MKAIDYSGISLAPMAGYSDEPFRRICHQMGSVLSYTEFVSTDAVVRDNLRTLQMLRYSEEERPILFQIFGYNEDTIVEAALRLEELRPDGFDLNLGCSVHKVAHKGSGAALLHEPRKIGRIIETLSRRLTLPVSAKMRLGWSDNTGAIEIARIIEGSGASMLAVHGRTAEQRYAGEADWQTIGKIKSILAIPVLGNGDVHSHEEAERRMDRYGVDGVLIGRAAQGNPWIFDPILDGHVRSEDVIDVMRRHLLAMIDFHGEEHGLLRFRKHALQYGRHLNLDAVQRSCLLQITSINQMTDLLLHLFHERDRDVPYSAPSLHHPGHSVLSDSP